MSADNIVLPVDLQADGDGPPHPISSAPTAMVDVPVLACLLDERYCGVSVMPDRGKMLTIYARKDLSACEQPSP